MPSSPCLFLFWMRSWQMRGSHLRQMMASRGQCSIRVSHRWLQMLNSEASMFPQLRMISPKMYRSAMGDLSEKCLWVGCSLSVLFQSWVREWSALSWKVKAHLLGSEQYRWRMLLPAVLVHSSTGSLMMLTSRQERRVLLPAPRLPSMEITPGIFELNAPAIIIVRLKFAPLYQQLHLQKQFQFTRGISRQEWLRESLEGIQNQISLSLYIDST